MNNAQGIEVKTTHPAFLDLHVHIGRDGDGQAVKITASSQLTLPNILKECVERKGIDIVGIVDCGTAGVLRDLKALVNAGELVEQSRGGFRYRDKLTLIGGVELETVVLFVEKRKILLLAYWIKLSA